MCWFLVLLNYSLLTSDNPFYFRVPQPKCVNVAIDCDREIERIHSLFLVYLEKLDELQSKSLITSHELTVTVGMHVLHTP